jgi:hypothetical protein
MQTRLLFVPLLLFLVQAAPASPILTNGDFSQGNTGFSSQYTYSPDSLVPGSVYAVTTDPHSLHPGAISFGGPTTGTGNMLAVNGSPTPGTEVWSETVSVTPNTTYTFTGSVASWGRGAGFADTTDPSPAVLSLSANNTAVGTVFSPLAQDGQWIGFSRTWNSGNSTSVTLSIVDLNTDLVGNDFVLTNLAFAADAVPEPASIALAGTGLLAALALGRRTRRRAAV